MKKTIATILAIAMTLCLLAACGAAPAPAAPAAAPAAPAAPAAETETKAEEAPKPVDDKVYELVFTTQDGANSDMWKCVDEPLLRAIEANSNGRIKFVEYIGGALCASGEARDALLDGTADVAFDGQSWYNGLYPVSLLLEQPLGLQSGPALSYAAWDMIEKFPEWGVTEYDNFVMLAPMCSGPRMVATTRPIRTLEDWKGIQIRTNNSFATIVQDLGGTPVFMGNSEVYDALQNHLVEGGIFSYLSYVASRYYEVCDYVTDMSCVQAVVCLYMSKSSFEALPADLQEVITTTAREFFESTSAWFYGDYAEKGMNFAKEQNPNLEWIRIDPETRAEWTEVLKPHLDSYLEMLNKDYGYDGQAILDYLLERYQYWCNELNLEP